MNESPQGPHRKTFRRLPRPAQREGSPRRESSRRPERAGILVALNGWTVQQRAASGPESPAPPRPARGGSDVKKLLFLVSVALIGAVLVSSQDDIRRYIKMRNM